MKKYPIVYIINNDYYGIEYEDKTINIQRRHIFSASQTPIMGYEETVIILCDKIMGEN